MTNIDTHLQKSIFFNQPRTIIILILGLAAIWIVYPGYVGTLALVGIVILFLFGFNNPIWAMAAILVSTFTISSRMIGTPWIDISLRLLLLMFTGIFLWRSRSTIKFELGESAKYIIIPILILTAFSIVSNLVNSGFEYTFRDFRNMLVGLLTVIFMAVVTKNIKDLKILSIVVLITVTASSIIAILQRFPILPGMGQTALIPVFESRVPGMTESALILSYITATVIPVIAGVLFVSKISLQNKLLLGLSFLLIGPALYFTYTRSAILAVLFGIASLFVFLKMRIRFEFILVALMVIILIVQVSGILESQYLSGRNEDTQESNAIGRKILYQAGLAIALDNPILGIGGDNFENVAPQYRDSVDPELLQYEEEKFWSFSTLGSTEIHNDFLGIWVFYGIFAFLSYLFLYFVIIRTCVNSYIHSNRNFIKGLSIGLAAGLIAYGINAFYHNLLSTFPLFWIIAGFSLAIAKLVEKEKVIGKIDSISADL
jgi:O-antigen ligase